MPASYAHFSAAITAEMSSYGSCRTTGVTAVVRAADGRRTTNKRP